MTNSVDIRDCARICTQWKQFSKKLILGYAPLILATKSLSSDSINIMLDNTAYIVNQLHMEAESNAELREAIDDTVSTLQAACVAVGGKSHPIKGNIDAIFIFVIEAIGPLLMSNILESEVEEMAATVAEIRDDLLTRKYPLILDAMIKVRVARKGKSSSLKLLDNNIGMVI